MAHNSHGSRQQPEQKSIPAPRQVVVEALEQRQLLSGTGGADSSGLALQHVMSADIVQDRVPTQHQLQIVQTWITNFEKHIHLEVKLHPHLQQNAHFQNTIAHQQAVFAAKVAKFGVTYTPIPYDSLLVGAAPLVAPTLTTTSTSATSITLNWTATAGVQHYVLQTSLNGVNWTTVSSPTTNTYVHSGLATDSTHKYRVAAVVAGHTSPYSAVKTATTLLPAPTGFTARDFSATRVDLHWTPVTHATSYKIERSPNNTTWTALAPSPALNAASVSYSDTAAAAGTTYYYRLTAIETLGNSAPTAGVQVLTLPAVPALTATAASATTVNLSWAAITGAATYKVETSTDGGNTWTTLGNPSTLTYANTALTADTAHKYRVSAVNATGSSATSNVASITTPLTAPTGFSVTAASSSRINLAWNPVTDATNYKIERSVDQTAWTALVPNPALNAGSVSYSDTSASAGTTYYYRISSLDAAGTSAPATVAHALTYPGTPVLTGTVTSATVITLNWAAITSATSYLVETSTDGGNTWTTASTPSTLTYANPALTADTLHAYRVSATNATGTGSTSNVITKTTLLASPTGLAASAASATEVDLIWNSETDATNYKLERSLDNTTWTAIIPSPALSGTSSTYADTALTAGTTFNYRISGIDAAGTSAASTSVHALTIPAVPTLTATVASATTVNLAWVAVKGAATYTLETSTDGGSTWSTLATPSTTTYANTGLTADTQYKYRLSSTDATGTSAPSNAVTATTQLTTVSGLTATATSATQINLAWTALNDATNYKIERSPDQTTWAALVLSPALNGASAAYSDTTLSAGTTYYYRISAIDASGTGAASTAAHALTVPAAPVLAGTSASATAINLSWATIKSAVTYTVETSLDGGLNWSTLGTPSTLTYANTGLTTDTQYKYRVEAVNATGSSVSSNIVTLTTLLTAPTGLSVTAASATTINVAWNPVIDATNYKIERSLNQTTWTALVPSPALAGTSASYADTGVSSGTTYYYRISAIDAAGTSAATTAVNTLTFAAAPTLAGTVGSATAINVSWAAVPTATSYLLERSVDAGATWQTLNTQSTLTYSNTALTADTAYKYRVSAINPSGTSATSNVVSLTTTLAPPTNFAATPASATEIDLAWTAVTHATNYKLERSLNQTTWTVLAPSPALAGTSASYNDTGLTAGTTYYYRISSINSVGTSVTSTVIHALSLPATPVLSGTLISATQINLSWTAISSATVYTVQISTNSGTTWTTLATPTQTTFSATGLTPDMAYEFRITVSNGAGSSAASNVVSLTTFLAAPAGFAATPSSSSPTEIDLSWTAVTHATTYKLERSLDNATWTTLAPSPALAGTDHAYADTGLSSGTTYFYRISAVNAVGASATAPVQAALTLPGQPVVTGTAGSAITINLTWPAVTGASSYLVEQSVDAGTHWTTATTQSGNTYTATGLTADSSYQYRVTASNATGSGAVSAVTTISTVTLAPTGFAVTTVSSPTEVDMSWTPVTHATSYLIERSTNQTTWTALAPNPALVGTSAAYNDTTASSATQYYYRISAVNAAGTSDHTASGSALTLPVAPATFTVTVNSATSVTSNWTAVTGATGYQLQRSPDGIHWTTLTTQTALSFTDTTATAGTAYTYDIYALDGSGSGAPDTANITTLLPAPTGFTATPSSSLTTVVDLAWTPVANAFSYQIERSINQANWTVLSPSPALVGTSAAFSDTTAVAGTNYFYRIEAIDTQVRKSAPSTVATALTLPAAPTLAATATSATTVALSWNPLASATSYLLERSSDAGTHWSTASTQTGTTFADTGLTADTAYQYEVFTLNATGSSAASTVANVTTILGSPAGFNVTASASSPAEIDLTWTATAHATGYKIERSLDNAIWTTITPATPLVGTSAAYADTTLSAGTTYFYRISGINAVGTSAPTTAASALTLPGTPTLSATATSATTVAVSWIPVKSTTSYLLEKSVDAGTHWTTASTQTAATFTDTGLTADTAYEYRVTASNGTGAGATSTVANVTTILASPAGFAVTASASVPTEIDLSWTATTHATGYKIERSLNQVLWTTITPATPLAGTDHAYADTSASAGTTYFYRLSAIDAVGTSAPTTAASALTIPVTPTLTESVTSATTINFVWNTVTGAATYLLEKSIDAGTHWTTAVSQTSTTFTDTGLTADTSYEYRLSAIDATGASATSSPVTLTTILGAVAGFTATASSTVPTEIDLAWTATTDATGYKVERSRDNSVWTTLVPGTPLVGTSAAYADTTVSAGSTYFYRISGLDAVGASAPSTSGAVLTIPATPTLTAGATSATSVHLSWTASFGTTTYLLEKSIDAGTHWTTAVTQAATSYDDTGLTADTAYEYRVSATDATGSSPTSTVANVTTILASPAGFTVTASTTVSTEIDLAWTAVTHATGYLIERSPDQQFWTTITPATPLAGTDHAYADTTASAGTTFFYRISAINAVGTSAPTTPASALTLPDSPVLSAVAESDTQIDLTWTPVDSATNYLVEKSIDAGTHWTTLSTLATTLISDTALTGDTTYEYRVSAINATGNSTPSGVQTITTLLSAPAGLAATAASAAEVDLSWTATTDATTYLIERSTDNMAFDTLMPATPLAGTDHTFADTTVSAGTLYYYRISAINANGTSAPSANVTVTTPLLPPTGFAATAVSASQINLSWTNDTDAGLLNFLLQSSTDNVHFTTLESVAAGSTSAADVRLTTATQYYYRLIAVNAGGNSAPTASVTATTM
jgi:titin